MTINPYGNNGVAPNSSPSSVPTPPQSSAQSSQSSTNDSLSQSTVQSSTPFLAALSTPVLSSPKPEIGILQFAQMMTKIKNALKDQLNQQQISNSLISNALFYANAVESYVANELYFILLNYDQQGSDAYNKNQADINTLSGDISAYTAGGNDQQAVTNLNAAVTQLNTATSTYNTTISQYPDPTSQQHIDAVNAYNTAITSYQTSLQTYNNYAGSRNAALTQLNHEIQTYNASVDQTNEQIFILNHTPPSYPIFTPAAQMTPSSYSLPTAPDAPTVPSNPNQPGSFITSANVPPTLTPPTNTITPAITDPAGFASAVYQAIFELVNGTVTANQKLFQNHADFQSFVLFVYTNKSPTFPDSYIDPKIRPFLAGSTGATTGSGVSSTTLASTVDHPLLSKFIDQAIFAALQAKFQQPLNPSTIGQIKYENLQGLSSLGLSSGAAAVRLLAGKLAFIDPKSSPTVMAFALNLAVQASAQNQNPALEGKIEQLLKGSNLTLSPNDLKEVAGQIANILHLANSLTVLSIVGQLLKDPTLTNKVFSASQESTLLQASLDAGQTTNVADVLKNPLSVASLKAALAIDLSKNSVEATTLANQLVDNSIKNNTIETREQLQESIQKELSQNNSTQLSQENITAVAQKAADYVQAEIQGGLLLDTAIKGRIGEDQQASLVKQEDITQALISQNQIDADSARQAVKKAFDNPNNVTVRNLRDDITDTLTQQGAFPGSSGLLAVTSATTTNQINPLAIQPVTSSQLKSEIESKALTQLTQGSPNTDAQTFSPADAKNIAQQLAIAIVGDEEKTSFHHSIAKDIERITADIKKSDINQKNQKYFDSVHDLIKEFQKTTYSMYAFNEQFKNPTDLLITSLHPKLMYGGTLPSEFTV